jgi:hypothetical protein
MIKNKKKKLLFLGFPFMLEGLYTKSDINNGYIAYSFNVLDELIKYYDVTVVTDKPSFFKKKNVEVCNIFNKNNLDENFSSSWKSLFSYILNPQEKIFQRDLIYRNWSVFSCLDIKKTNDLINDNNFSFVLFNRCDFFFLSLLFKNENQKKIMLSHDSQFLRKKSFSSAYKYQHRLLAFEKSVEQILYKDFNKIIAISPLEQKFFAQSVNSDRVVLYRPTINIPKQLAKISLKKTIKAYFLGSAHFSNAQLFLDAYSVVRLIRRSGLKIEFYGIGAFAKSLSKKDFSCNGYKLLGDIKDLNKVMLDLDLQICPIKMGSGAPTKIAEGLNFGHFILTSSFGSSVYPEFKETRIFTGNNPLIELKKMEAECEKKECFTSYKKYNKLNNLRDLI